MSVSPRIVGVGPRRCRVRGSGLGSVRSRPRRCPWLWGVSVGPSGWRDSVAWAVYGLSGPAAPDSPDAQHPSGSEMLRKCGSAKAPLKCSFYFSC